MKQTYWRGPEQWGQLFDDYCQETADLTLMLGEDSTLSSTMLRRDFECLINCYRPDEWAMVQNELVLLRDPRRGLSLSHSFRHLLGYTCHYRRLEDN